MAAAGRLALTLDHTQEERHTHCEVVLGLVRAKLDRRGSGIIEVGQGFKRLLSGQYQYLGK